VVVKVNVPVGVFEAVATVRVEFPDAVTEAGLYDAVAPAGSPLALNATVPVKPLVGVTVTVYVVLAPCVTVWLEGLALTEKSV
jgi:hypothetical protein